jgi:hypothetical protein
MADPRTELADIIVPGAPAAVAAGGGPRRDSPVMGGGRAARGGGAGGGHLQVGGEADDLVALLVHG